jgi:hypothetical protein
MFAPELELPMVLQRFGHGPEYRNVATRNSALHQNPYRTSKPAINIIAICDWTVGAAPAKVGA